MARFTMAEADNYSQSNAGSYFALKDDKDTARVRFLYKTVDDIVGYAVYRVQVGDKERYVNAIRAYNDRSYNEAKSMLESILHFIPDDKPSYIYYNKSCEKLALENQNS